jgi:protein SCO1/2
MKRLLLLLLIVIAGLGSAVSCKRTSGNEKRYELKGKVVIVEPEKHLVTISHGDIKGYMPGMTMAFTVPNDSDLQMLVAERRGHGDAGGRRLAVMAGKPFRRGQQDAPSAPPTAAAVQAKEGDDVPNYALVNQDAKEIRIRNYRGKALLLTFIFTRCQQPEFCSLMSDNFAQIVRKLGEDPQLYGKTHLLSISIDPAYDKPDVLRSYGAAHTERYENETFAHWEFAGGSEEQVKDIAQYFGLRYFPRKRSDHSQFENGDHRAGWKGREGLHRQSMAA